MSLFTTYLFVYLLPIDESKMSIFLHIDESTYYLLMSLLTSYWLVYCLPVDESTYYLLMSLLTTCLFVYLLPTDESTYYLLMSLLLPIDESKMSIFLPIDESTYYLLMSLLTTYWWVYLLPIDASTYIVLLVYMSIYYLKCHIHEPQPFWGTKSRRDEEKIATYETTDE